VARRSGTGTPIELGLYHYRARMYDPVAGRFCSRDPIGYANGHNRYSYVSARAISRNDALGLFTFEIGPNGSVVAISEPGDTLSDALNIGISVPPLFPGMILPQAIPAGSTFDVSHLFDPQLIEMIRDQQNLPVSEILESLIRRRVPVESFPPGTTIGESGIPLFYPPHLDDDENVCGGMASSPQFGFGECYSFVAINLGANQPGIQPRDLGVGDWPDLPGPGLIHVGGFPQILNNQGHSEGVTTGHICTFGNGGALNHAAIIAGVSRDGTIYLLQKLNSGGPIVIWTLEDTMEVFGESVTISPPPSIGF